MKDFMVEFKITGNQESKEFQALVPAERLRIDELLESGEIKDIWLKEDYSGGYFLAQNQDVVSLNNLFASLPLLPFLSFKFFELKDK